MEERNQNETKFRAVNVFFIFDVFFCFLKSKFELINSV